MSEMSKVIDRQEQRARDLEERKHKLLTMSFTDLLDEYLDRRGEYLFNATFPEYFDALKAELNGRVRANSNHRATLDRAASWNIPIGGR